MERCIGWRAEQRPSVQSRVSMLRGRDRGRTRRSEEKRLLDAALRNMNTPAGREQLQHVDLRWHDLRHEGGCLLADGVDIRIIHLMLGHASIQLKTCDCGEQVMLACAVATDRYHRAW